MTSRTALVTGGSRGIGRACVLRLARDGFDVAVNYHKAAAEADEVASEVRSLGRRALTIPADVSQTRDVDRMVSTVEQEWGRLDLLVTNAGISAVRAVEDLGAEEWDHVQAVNLKGTFLCAQRVIAVMRRQRSGQMILMASQAGITGGIFIGLHYATSKAGVICLAKSLAKQLAAHGIRVNCVAPGIVETDMVTPYPREKLEALVASVPLGRIGQPDDVASAVGFLASSDAAYMTGTTVHVNGGIYMP
jgi:3-oxoacyl-[acyl-carrier protein] reductase